MAIAMAILTIPASERFGNMQTALAFEEFGELPPKPPEIHYLAMTTEERDYLLLLMEGCVYSDEEAVSIRNRLRVMCGIPYLTLVGTKQ